MRGRINPRGLRIMISMLVCLVAFKVATIVSHADSLPGVEYRSCAEETGWTKWVRNGETSGDISTSKKLEAVKIILTDTTEGDIRYKVYLAGKGWTQTDSNGVTIGGTEGIQAIKICLDGEMTSSYKVAYRVHMQGGNWTNWVTDTKEAGDVSGTVAIDGLEVKLLDKNGADVTGEAADYSKDLPVAEGQQPVTIEETEVVRSSTPSDNTQTETGTTPEAPVDNTQPESGTTPEAPVDNTQPESGTTPEAPVDNTQPESGTTPEAPVDNTQPETPVDNTTPTDNKAQELCDKLVKVATDEENYSQGSDGTTKYGQWWANRVGDNAFSKAAWSSMFLAWCGDQAGLTAEQYGYYAYSDYWKEWFINNNSYHTTDGYIPKPGDMVFWDYKDESTGAQDGKSNHNGMVLSATETSITVIEGNVDGAVVRKDYQLNDPELLGYGTPLFDKETTTVAPSAQTPSDDGSTGNANGGTGYMINELADAPSPIHGIDVSKWQGDINWSAVAQDVDFAIIKLGQSKRDGSMFTDKYFYSNIQGAQSAGVDVGVYFYTEATTVEKAKQEAQYCIEKLAGYNLKYPVVYDTEESDGVSKSKKTEMATTFMKAIAEAGYRSQVYASKFFYYDNLDMNVLNGYDLWVAHYFNSKTYTTKTDFSYPFSIWQYTDAGSVSGVSGNVDRNVCYKQY